MTGPLEGVLVADFSRVLAGPLAGMLLGDLGATVIKVERPERGDDSRHWPPYSSDGISAYFASVNRNKQAISLDLTYDTDLRRAQTLADRADVLIENYKPGTLDNRGLGWEQVSRRNPALVYCSITGFGRHGGAELPGYDLIAQAVGGLMSMTGPADGSATKVSPPLVDVITGLHATIGILAALHERHRSGAGQRVEVNLLRSLLSGMVNQSTAYLHTGTIPRRLGNDHPNIAPYAPFPTSDGELVVTVGNDDQFKAFAAALGLPELAEDDRFRRNADRVAHRPQLTKLISARTVTASTSHWSATLTRHKVPHGPINDLAEAFATAERLGLRPVAAAPADGARNTDTLAHPVDYSRTPATYRALPPLLDADGARLRDWLDADTQPVPGDGKAMTAVDPKRPPLAPTVGAPAAAPATT